jgi:hypothetical protein
MIRFGQHGETRRHDPVALRASLPIDLESRKHERPRGTPQSSPSQDFPLDRERSAARLDCTFPAEVFFIAFFFVDVVAAAGALSLGLADFAGRCAADFFFVSAGASPAKIRSQPSENLTEEPV